MALKGSTYSHTEETKQKISLAKVGSSPWNKGKKTGQTPWNKGKQVKTNTGRTHFKKGHKPVNPGFKKGMTPWNKGKNHVAVSGSKSHLWRGGITPINFKLRHSVEYKIWRTAVFERDNYTCIWCGARNGSGRRVVLHADHIKPFAFFPELRFAIDNGRTLCVDCHKTTETYCGRAKKYNA
jgi:hypothetical protein